MEVWQQRLQCNGPITKSHGYWRQNVFLCAVSLLFLPLHARGQIALPSAVNLALKNSPRMRVAEDNVRKAEAVLTETKDVFIPSITGSSGLGASSGITLNVPTIFTIGAQSLVFNSSQRDYIRAAGFGLQSSQLALQNVREEVEEDTIITYLSLSSALERQAAMTEQRGSAVQLLSIMESRFGAGIENELDVKRARRTATQIELERLQLEDEVSSTRDHLARLLGVPDDPLVIEPGSIPSTQALTIAGPHTSSSNLDSPNVLSAAAGSRSKLQRAFGDSRGTWVPQVAFAAQYGRISPFNGVSSYYNLQGDYNTLSIGVQIQLPFLDRARKARALESTADAMHATHELSVLRDQEGENLLKLQHSVRELAVKAKLAEIDDGIASDELQAILIGEAAESGSGAAPPRTPKDEQTARIQERQKYLDLSNTSLELHKAQINLLRQMGELDDWLKSSSVSGR